MLRSLGCSVRCSFSLIANHLLVSTSAASSQLPPCFAAVPQANLLAGGTPFSKKGLHDQSERWEFLELARSEDLDKWRKEEERISSSSSSFFEVFNADPRDFRIDLKELEKRYKTLQKYLHPDKLATGCEERRTLGETYSTLVNEAYAVLRQPLSRAKYMLDQRGYSIDEHTDMPDLDFLQNVMEIREELDGDLDKSELKALEDEMNGKIQELVSEIGDLLKREAGWPEAKALTAKLKYYDNILREIIRLS
jgi:molecular chaperone HscB